MEFTASETNTYRMIGLSNGNSHQNYDDIDFALYPAIGGTLYVFEGGSSRGTFGSYATGDTLRVAVESGVVKYRKNGVLLYTSTVTLTYPLLVDTALYSNNSTISNVVMGGNLSGGGGLSATVHWLVSDHLGTPRMIFDQSGSLANVSRHDYLPFGEELFAAVGGRTAAQGYAASDNVRQKFTSKERDNETGLDYFLARYYSSTQGRFTSPDEFSGGPDELYDFADDASENQAEFAPEIRRPMEELFLIFLNADSNDDPQFRADRQEIVNAVGELDRLKRDVAALGASAVAEREMALAQERDETVRRKYTERHKKRRR